MANSTRMSSILPTIKCSMCAADIEISRMGEHVCRGTEIESTPPMESSMGFGLKPFAGYAPAWLQKSTSRSAPPRVDTSAANRPFDRRDQLTPVSSSSESRSASPRTPYDTRGAYNAGPQSASLGARQNATSPEILSANANSPSYALFPNSKALFGSRTLDVPYASQEEQRPPTSPSTAGSLLQRMNTIAPGPFDVNGNRRQARVPSRAGTSTGDENPRGRRSNSSSVSSGHSRTMTGPSLPAKPFDGQNRAGTVRAPKLDKPGGYGGFGPPLRTEPGELLRSQTFPEQISQRRADLGVEELSRRPSEPGLGMRDRRPSNITAAVGAVRNSPPAKRRPSANAGIENFQALPVSPRSVKRSPSKAQEQESAGNAYLGANLDIGNPYHTPSLSQSSNESERSGLSQASSRSSPPREAARGRRKPSDTTNIDALLGDLQMSLQASISPIIEQPEQRQQRRQPLASRPDPIAPGDFRLGPSAQFGRPLASPTKNGDFPRNQATIPPSSAVRRPSSSKGDCKACGIAIKGKSISSADGRLTGRYHKECFVCKTCSEPFATATFYVINDSPYCERHYHKLNNSVCKTCDRGIEGQYLETEGGTKHHPKCLTCTDCRKVLKDDYFEMNGKIFCERDAFRKMQQRNFLGPGGRTNRMERRTTRMMMI